MKKCLLLLLFIFIPINVYAVNLDIYSKNALLYNLNDGSILYEKNSNEKVSIASITKVMTAIVSIENIDNLDERVNIIREDFKGLYEANASLAGFSINDSVTYRDLLSGLLLPSGAEAAQALSRLVGGGEANFILMMNAKAKELGMNDTTFSNTTGLDDINNYSTLSDVYKMFSYAIKNDEFLDIIKHDVYTTTNNKTFKSTIRKTKDAYKINDMDYLIGGKSGSTGDAGLCLASIAKKDDVLYMLITTGAPFSRDKAYTLLDAKTIYEYFMNNYSYKNIVTKGDILVSIDTLYTKDDSYQVKASRDISKYLENSFDKEKIVYEYKGIKTIDSKMDEGLKLGEVLVKYDGETLDMIPVILEEKQEFSLYKYLYVHKYLVFTIIFSITFLLILLFVVIKRKKK